MSIPEAIRALIAEQQMCVIATKRPDGGIRQSLVFCALHNGQIIVSTTGTREKVKDVERAQWASICIHRQEGLHSPSVTIEGSARIVRDDVGELTRHLYEVITGSSGSAPSDSDLAAENRVILEISPDRWYGASYLDISASS